MGDMTRAEAITKLKQVGEYLAQYIALVSIRESGETILDIAEVLGAAAPSLPSARQISDKWQPNWQGIINETQATAITEEIFERLSSDKVSKENAG